MVGRSSPSRRPRPVCQLVLMLYRCGHSHEGKSPWRSATACQACPSWSHHLPPHAVGSPVGSGRRWVSRSAPSRPSTCPGVLLFPWRAFPRIQGPVKNPDDAPPAGPLAPEPRPNEQDDQDGAGDRRKHRCEKRPSCSAATTARTHPRQGPSRRRPPHHQRIHSLGLMMMPTAPRWPSRSSPDSGGADQDEMPIRA